MIRRTPPLSVFAIASIALHVGAFVGLSHRGSASAARPSFDAVPAPLVGETLDVDEAAPAEAEQQSGDDESSADDTSHPGESAAPARRPTRVGSKGAAAGEAHPPPALFGAVGVRYATDLATTFTRAFPQAASADGIWNTASFGSAGIAEVTLMLDDTGHLESHGIGGSPSPALRRGIERTLLLMGPRAFTARGATTRLRVTARVTSDVVHDGLHGDVFALSGGSFSGDLGSAFFTLPGHGGPGRRIDVELRLLP
ncbi:MAG TPA: hypothetical protein VF765_26690 [Polyangiaceae bacterium]